jgi:hypothetical protein
MKRHYTEAKKRHHVQKAYELVAKGGTFLEYVALSGISRASLQTWRKQFGRETQVEKSQTLVALGKVATSQVPMQRVVVSYYGATIEITSEDALLALLKNLRAANNELV